MMVTSTQKLAQGLISSQRDFQKELAGHHFCRKSRSCKYDSQRVLPNLSFLRSNVQFCVQLGGMKEFVEKRRRSFKPQFKRRRIKTEISRA